METDSVNEDTDLDGKSVEPSTKSDIEVIKGSARQTTALAIRRRQLLTEETATISDVALSIAVEFTDHRTCFADISHGFCSGCDDVVDAGLWVDKEMDRAGVPREARVLPYATYNAPAM